MLSVHHLNIADDSTVHHCIKTVYNLKQKEWLKPFFSTILSLYLLSIYTNGRCNTCVATSPMGSFDRTTLAPLLAILSSLSYKMFHSASTTFWYSSTFSTRTCDTELLASSVYAKLRKSAKFDTKKYKNLREKTSLHSTVFSLYNRS